LTAFVTVIVFTCGTPLAAVVERDHQVYLPEILMAAAGMPVTA
jgi:hypothetical protein